MTELSFCINKKLAAPVTPGAPTPCLHARTYARVCKQKVETLCPYDPRDPWLEITGAVGAGQKHNMTTMIEKELSDKNLKASDEKLEPVIFQQEPVIFHAEAVIFRREADTGR